MKSNRGRCTSSKRRLAVPKFAISNVCSKSASLRSKMSKLFLTGGSGFLGSRVLERLARRESQVIALDRSGSLKNNRVSIVGADLLAPDKYRHRLVETDVVVHLAASTGRATRDEHFRVNT